MGSGSNLSTKYGGDVNEQIYIMAGKRPFKLQGSLNKGEADAQMWNRTYRVAERPLSFFILRILKWDSYWPFRVGTKINVKKIEIKGILAIGIEINSEGAFFRKR